jgi:ribosomal protein S18 acetylase RimI-like enzyme
MTKPAVFVFVSTVFVSTSMEATNTISPLGAYLHQSHWGLSADGSDMHDNRRESHYAGAILTFDLPHYQVTVRELREADTRALEWQGGADLRSWYEEQWAQHRSGASCVLVADFNGFPIGQVAIQWEGKPTHPHIPDLQSFRVFPAFRGMGIGSRLLQASEYTVQARGFAQVSLAVTPHNTAARRLYERRGYHVVGDVYNFIWHYTDARGQTVRVEETVIDMVKTFAGG